MSAEPQSGVIATIEGHEILYLSAGTPLFGVFKASNLVGVYRPDGWTQHPLVPEPVRQFVESYAALLR